MPFYWPHLPTPQAAAQAAAQAGGVGMLTAGGVSVPPPSVYHAHLGSVPVGMAGAMAGGMVGGMAASQQHSHRFGGGSDQGMGYYQGRPGAPGGTRGGPANRQGSPEPLPEVREAMAWVVTSRVVWYLPISKGLAYRISQASKASPDSKGSFPSSF
ncbi:hypothetical protein CLOM_g19918 [Closterium sp. NIES-68]|nr:hypothetical protein CLOM_g19918 [Closterium sp. NIES-68]